MTLELILPLIILVLIIIAVTVIAAERGWNNVTLEERNEIVFENKNKKYGAFEIRKDYNKTLTVAALSACALLVVAVGAPVLLKNAGEEENEKTVKVDEVKLVEPPPVKDEVLPPPPPPPPPPPMVKQIQFTEPEVTEDVVEEIPPQQEEIKGKIGDVTQEGEEEVMAPIDPGEGVGGEEIIHTFVEQQPSFPGGDEALMKYLKTNIKYPAFEADNGISGTVVLTFVVDRDGNISDVKTLKPVKGGPNLEKEAIRVVKSMPQWKPGKMNGKAVKVQFNLPVRFELR